MTHVADLVLPDRVHSAVFTSEAIYKDELEHIRKWPAEHWKLAFQGQLRTVSEADAELLLARMHAASGVAA